MTIIDRLLPSDSRDRCPRCAGTKVSRILLKPGTFGGYGPELANCIACRAIWEPLHHDLLWDPDDPLCAFSEPCNNCAFRPGSEEQRDPAKWAKIRENIAHSGGFFCHKGVPIEAGAEHGFAYPYRDVEVTFAGETASTRVPDRDKLRYCRGWLNAWGARMDKDIARGRR